jgi:hypothetical protein
MSPSESDIIVVTEAWRHWDFPFYLRARLKVLSLSKLRPTFILCDSDQPLNLGPGIYVSASKKTIRTDQVSGCYLSYAMRRFENIPVTKPEQRTNLTFFSGTTANHAVRKKIASEPTLREFMRSKITDSDAAENQYKHDLLTSKFALCPRGKGSSSYRLFEAMSVGCVPVIISDDWVEPPFVDWATCSVRIPENQVDSIISHLTSIGNTVEELAANCREIYQRNYSTLSFPSYLVRSIRSIPYNHGHAGFPNQYELNTELRQLVRLIIRRKVPIT